MMKKGSYLISREEFSLFMKDPAMNNEEGVYVFFQTDANVAKLLPPPLTLASSEIPLGYIYIVNIREPTFAPWYMEGGIGVFAKYGEQVGMYFFNLQLSGPGALMGAFSGREGSGLPKKLCDRIVVDRIDDSAHAFIERHGVRLVDVELEIGKYNDPGMDLMQADKAPGVEEQGGCLLHKYQMGGKSGITNMSLIYYDSPTVYHTWEPATAAVRLASSVDDPWAEIPVVRVLGGAHSINSNRVTDVYELKAYTDEEAREAMCYLYSGRYDRCCLCKGHQLYGA